MTKLMGKFAGAAITLVLQMHLASAAESPEPGKERGWLPADSAQIRYFLTGQGDWSWTYEKGSEGIVSSPTAQHFFFVSYHGDLQCDCNVYRLSVFAVKDVIAALSSRNTKAAKPPAPEASVEMRSPSQAIRSAVWDSDGSGILFAGENGGQKQQLYRLQTSGELTKLTDAPGGAAWYRKQGESLIYNALFPGAPITPAEYPIYALTPKNLTGALSRGRFEPVRLQTYAAYGKVRRWPLSGDFAPGEMPWFSPDGRYAVMVLAPRTVPPTWGRYNGKEFGKDLPKPLVPEEFNQLFLIDFENGRDSPIFDAPIGDATQAGQERTEDSRYSPLAIPASAFWSKDSKHVVLVNTALPLSAGDRERESMSYIIDFDIAHSKFEVLEPIRQPSGAAVSNVEWMQPGTRFLVEHRMAGKPTPTTMYTYEHGRWVGRAVAATVRPKPAKIARPSFAGGLQVAIEESANTAPAVVARMGTRQLALTEPDPALENLSLAKTVPFEWRDTDGIVHTEGLLLPKITAGDRPVPLVIQTGYYVPDQFRPDGPFPTGYAAQALVARGLAVLNFTGPTPRVKTPKPIEGTVNELPTFVSWVDQVVASLSKKYPVDIHRVGLMGFSHTAYLTYHAATHPGSLRLAAAVVADGVTGSYLYYLDSYARGATPPKMIEDRMGVPFYKGKLTWLEKETTFNVDRVQAPVLFVGDEGMYALETIGAFEAAHKPYEYLAMPGAAHQLERPRQRQASLEATVEWMAYWLNGYENPSPEKRAQYERWRALREEQERNNASSSPTS